MGASSDQSRNQSPRPGQLWRGMERRQTDRQTEGDSGRHTGREQRQKAGDGDGAMSSVALPTGTHLSTHLTLLSRAESKMGRWEHLVNQPGESSAAVFLQLKFSSSPWCRKRASRGEVSEDRRPVGMPLTGPYVGPWARCLETPQNTSWPGLRKPRSTATEPYKVAKGRGTQARPCPSPLTLGSEFSSDPTSHKTPVLSGYLIRLAEHKLGAWLRPQAAV